jgi:hypothetical protein
MATIVGWTYGLFYDSGDGIDPDEILYPNNTVWPSAERVKEVVIATEHDNLITMSDTAEAEESILAPVPVWQEQPFDNYPAFVWCNDATGHVYRIFPVFLEQ